ncbi:4'-phosphopantetheinyl transferase family protein [Streptomyces sp. S063]|uniref:4'-phosphopantetheinyl transferase family protein n=1 Tax=Streptomyces sp. S063 TaxID=2005885 RepID=UPI0010085A59|nr:4'-phosphopantetheinyl transferase superfamily protein [Streptomyces sp. S063]
MPERPPPPVSPGLFDGLLPDRAHAADCLGDPAGLRPHPMEAAEPGAAAVVRRRREFATARWCARRALAAAGAPDPVGPLRRGRRGEPLWPAGFTGSITHSGAYRAAVAAPARPGHVLGIDAERAVPLRPAVAAAIAYGEEPAHLAALPPVAGLPWETLLFSVKEAVYKAWNPLTAAPLGFGSARVAFRPRTRPGPGRAGSTGTLTAVPVGGPALPVLTGRYRAACGLLVCVVHSWPSA